MQLESKAFAFGRSELYTQLSPPGEGVPDLVGLSSQVGCRQTLPESARVSSAHRYEEQLSQGRPDLCLRQTQYVLPAGVAG